MSVLICLEDKPLMSLTVLELTSVSSVVLCGWVGWPASIELNTARMCCNTTSFSYTHSDMHTHLATYLQTPVVHSYSTVQVHTHMATTIHAHAALAPCVCSGDSQLVPAYHMRHSSHIHVSECCMARSLSACPNCAGLL